MATVNKVARENVSLRRQVTESLRLAILDGRLQPGQKLVERELCEQLDISRTLLREALQQLQAEGLITTILHKGPSVAIIGADEVREIYEIRMALEVLIGRAFVENASDEQVKKLRDQLALFKRRADDGSPRDLLIAKSSFYGVLFEGCRNRIATEILTQLNNRMMLYKRLSLNAPGRRKQVAAELEAIVSAIETRNVERTAELCALHINNARQTVMRQLAIEQVSIRSSGGSIDGH